MTRVGVAIQAQFLDRLFAHHENAASGGLAPPARSADVDGLAGHDRGAGLPHVHGIGIHDPGHGLFVGVYVGRGDVLFRTDELEEFGGVAARHALQFALRHFVRIANDAALGAAEGNVHHRALPRHPARQRAHFVEVHVGCVAQSALGRAARNRVLHPESGEHFEVPIVHLHRDMTIISRLGLRSTFHRPSSRFSFCAARSKRAACACQGLVSCSRSNAVVIKSPYIAKGTITIFFSYRASLAKYMAAAEG
jgi:hypothetical protein